MKSRSALLVLILLLSGCLLSDDIKSAEGTASLETTSGSEQHEHLDGSGGGIIAFENEEKPDYNFELYVMNADGSAVTKLTNNPAYDGCPCFSPDRKQIAFSSNRSGSMQIYLFDLAAYLKGEEQGLVQLTQEGNNYYPAWAPDNSAIAFVSDRDGVFKIYKMDINGGNEELYIDRNGAIFPSWSSDGSKIVFSALVNGTSEIYTMDTDGKNIRRLTNNAVSDQFAAFSPDGERIAYSTSDKNTHFDICIMDINGMNIVKLIDHYALDELPKWSPDGTKIVFRSSISGSDQITVMNADGSNVQVLTHLKGQSMPYDWKPMIDFD